METSKDRAREAGKATTAAKWALQPTTRAAAYVGSRQFRIRDWSIRCKNDGSSIPNMEGKGTEPKEFEQYGAERSSSISKAMDRTAQFPKFGDRNSDGQFNIN